MVESGPEQIRSSLNQLIEGDDELHWPAAASVSRGSPSPTLMKSSSKSSRSGTQKSVRIVEPSSADVRCFEPAPQERPLPEPSHYLVSTSEFRQRLQTSANDHASGQEWSGPSGRFELDLPPEEGNCKDLFRPIQPASEMPPIVGDVQERPRRRAQLGASEPSSSANDSQRIGGMSRFKTVRQAQKQNGSSSPNETFAERLTVSPLIRTGGSRGDFVREDSPRPSELVGTPIPAPDADIIQASKEEVLGDEWLDENGLPMSAFRKARFQKQGLAPPGGLKKAMPLAPSTKSEMASDTGFEKEIDPADLKASVSAENYKKIAAMTPEQIQRNIKELEAMFGKDILQGLRNRNAPSRSSVSQEAQRSMVGSASAPEKPPFTDSSHSSSALELLVFDLQGRSLPVPPRNSLPGHYYHQHADRDDTNTISVSDDSYSAAFLLLLSRSIIAGQRGTAINVLNKVVALHGAQAAYTKVSDDHKLRLVTGEVPTTEVVATHFLRADFYLQVALISVTLLHDRPLGVRQSALRTLRVLTLFGALVDNHAADANKQDNGDRSSFSRQLLDAGLLSGIANVLDGDALERVSSRDLVIEVLIQIIHNDPALADDIAQHEKGRFLHKVIQSSLKVPWPSLGGSASANLDPLPRACTLLQDIIQASRIAAQLLVSGNILDFLLRFLAVQPWDLNSGHSTDTETFREVSRGYEILERLLHVYIALARYGLYASLVSRAWELLSPIHRWAASRIRSGDFLQQCESSVITAFYQLLAVWTICATDPHQTTPEHEITWSQVSEWVNLSMEATEALPSNLRARRDAHRHLEIFAAAGEHLRAWVNGATINDPVASTKRASEITALISTLAGYPEFGGLVLDHLMSASRLAPSKICSSDGDSEGADETDAQAMDDVRETVATWGAAFHFLQFSAATQQGFRQAGLRIIEAPTLSLILERLSDKQRLTALSFAMECCLGSRALPARSVVLGSLLRLLRPGEEDFAQDLVCALISESENMLGFSLQALNPFYLEALGLRPNQETEAKRSLVRLPVQLRPVHLKRLLSQRLPGSTRGECHEAVSEFDPVTRSALWKCPASDGLPLRPDWPLLPLDDLLRSAEAAVFNRADNLPTDWDPNERELVKDSLAFGCWYVDLWVTRLADHALDSPLSDEANRPYLGPGSTHLQLAAQKVLMMESGIQGDLQKWTGKVTGKDLFRDPEIVPFLRKLLELSATLSRQEHGFHEIAPLPAPPTLEQLSLDHFGPDVSYYSFFTDLVGLYDSTSFGDTLFAQALLPPLAPMRYAPDYRRLLWKDYAHLLPTIRTPVESVDLVSFLLPSSETGREDDDLILSYALPLIQGRVAWQKAQEQVIARIAVHHIAAYLWLSPNQTAADDTSAALRGDSRAPSCSSGQASLAKALLMDWEASTVPLGLQKLLLEYDVQQSLRSVDPKIPYANFAELDRRNRWLEILAKQQTVKESDVTGTRTVFESSQTA